MDKLLIVCKCRWVHIFFHKISQQATCFVFRKWKEEKAALLEEMDEKERQDQEDGIAQGKKELEEWYARLNEQLGKTQENNRYSIIYLLIWLYL